MQGLRTRCAKTRVCDTRNFPGHSAYWRRSYLGHPNRSSLATGGVMSVRTVVRLFVTVSTLVLTPIVALQSQTCLALASYETTPFRVTAGVSLSEDETAYGASFGAGSEKLFGSVGLGGTHFDGLDASGFTVGGSVGYGGAIAKGNQTPRPPRRCRVWRPAPRSSELAAGLHRGPALPHPRR